MIETIGSESRKRRYRVKAEVYIEVEAKSHKDARAEGELAVRRSLSADNVAIAGCRAVKSERMGE